MGNLFSVKRACEHAGLRAEITTDRRSISASPAVILPGIGAFGDAMGTLRRLDLVSVLRDVAASGTPLLGICLGLQLLMSESHEFGTHEGLNIIPGTVVRFEGPSEGDRRLKVPQVGWNELRPVHTTQNPWAGSLLEGIGPRPSMYFVHSFYVQPTEAELTFAVTRYGGIEFCSVLRSGNVFGCQPHPERSGTVGLKVYENLAGLIQSRHGESARD
jgi:glutamine amidotransferase